MLRSAGFACGDAVTYTPDVFDRPEAVVSRVVVGTIDRTRAVFLFGSCAGHPVALEGVFSIPRVPVAAALLEAQQSGVWLETWTTDRAYRLGWQPAHHARILSDGRTLLVWEGFAQRSDSFQQCYRALGRTVRDSARAALI